LRKQESNALIGATSRLREIQENRQYYRQ